MDRTKNQMGPYRATRLWNDVIKTFRTGMPVGRHRRYMKSYDNCFVASEAVDWLHSHLTKNPNFGPSVTRAQTLQLLQKFQKAGVIEDIRGSKQKKNAFSDSGALYRFKHNSPVKNNHSSPARPPLATRTKLMNEPGSIQHPIKLDHENTKTTGGGSPECHLVSKIQLSPQEVEELWKSMTLSRLQRVLQLDSLMSILDSDYVSAQNIMHNMTHINKNGVVTNIEKSDQLPPWIMSAMRCLAYWPDKVEESLPDYPGFEKDVFKVVKDHFESLTEPLLTYAMYEVFANVMVCAETGQKPVPSLHGNSYSSTPAGMASFASVENLMLNMTLNAAPGTQYQAYEVDIEGLAGSQSNYSSAANRMSVTQLSNSNSHGRSLRRAETVADFDGRKGRSLSRSKSSANSLAPRLETSFGIDNSEPRTHVSVQNPDPVDFGYFSSSTLPGYKPRPATVAGYTTDIPWYASSVSSVGHQYGHDEPFVAPEQKCFSTTDLTKVPPCPENELSRHERKKSRVSISSHDSLKTSDQGGETRGTYGYTVVLSSAPRSDSNRDSQYTNNYVINNHNSNQPNTTHQSLGHADPWVMRVEDFDSHNYPPPYVGPPPYVPPPSYGSATRPNCFTTISVPSRTDMSASSYETASSQTPHNSHSLLYHSVDNSRLNSCSRPCSAQGLSQSLRTSRACPAESFRQAIEHGSIPYTPVGNTLFATTIKRSASSPNILSSKVQNKVLDAIQICCLLLPPANRRKLHLLLRLMYKMASNTQLALDDRITIRDLVLETFTRCILCSQDEVDYDYVLALRLSAFMMDHYAEIMKIPESHKTQIEERLSHMRRAKIFYVFGDASGLTYCKQVTVHEYEEQKLSASQLALGHLLEGIIKNHTLSGKDRRKRLKQFEKNHPDVYRRRFPTSESETELFPDKPKIKPPLLSRPLQKLRSIRL